MNTGATREPRMLEITRRTTSNALRDWADSIAHYDDLRPSLFVAERFGRMAGVEWTVGGRAPHDAYVERAELAEAVATEILADDGGAAVLTLIIFDTFWRSATVVNLRRGGVQLIERFARRYGSFGDVLAVAREDGAAGVRWCATIEIGWEDLAAALVALEADAAGLVVSASAITSPSRLMVDLFDDANGASLERPLWPLWVARRAASNERSLLAHELTDHSGRRVLLLGPVLA